MSEENPYQAPRAEPSTPAGPVQCPDCGTTMESGYLSGRARWYTYDPLGGTKRPPKDLLTPAISLTLTELKAPGHHCPQCKLTIFKSPR